MKILNILFLISLICYFGAEVSGQNLKSATIQYFTKDHYLFDCQIVKSNKIRLVEKYWIYYKNDSIDGEFLLEKHQFDTLGNPQYVYQKEVGADKREIYYKYDSLGNLIEKEKYGISPESNYRNIDSYEWIYDRNGFLTRQRRYLVINRIPTEKGGYGFPEEEVLFTNDSISYNSIDTAALVTSNNLENVKDVLLDTGYYPVYPPNFRSETSTILKFHSNNEVYHKIVKRDSIIQRIFFDECGNPTKTKRNSKLDWLEKILSKSIKCLNPELLNILNRIDTITMNDRLLFYEEYKFNNVTHLAMGPEYTNTNGTIYYDLDIRKIFTESTISSKSAYAPGFYQEYRKQEFEYFEYGLLKRIVTKDENGKRVNAVEYRIEYFE